LYEPRGPGFGAALSISYTMSAISIGLVAIPAAIAGGILTALLARAGVTDTLWEIEDIVRVVDEWEAN
jgi:hypothetical protein